MVYSREEHLILRDLEHRDAKQITEAEIAQGWHQSVNKYLERLRDRNEGKCISIVAEMDGEVVGYINVYPDCAGGPFGGKGLPEIVDFGVLEKCRCRGIGSRLMDLAERIAGQYADTVCVGVGLHYGYGSAQRMYVKRGYIPDGTGVWYRNQVCEQYADCCNDDDLVLYFSRKLR